MRVLVTGHLGNIGSRLMERLSAYYFDDLKQGGEWELFGIDTKGGKNILTCELPKDIDVIYHLAAHAPVEHSWNDPVRTMENLTATVFLSTKYPNAKIIFASTGASMQPETSPYAFSKWACNEYLKKFHKNHVILYFPNIFGLPRSVVNLFKGKDEVVIYGDGEQIRDYVHVDDIVIGLDKASFWDIGEYFMGSGIGTNLLQLAEGKTVIFKEARKEHKESILTNNTPNWSAIINVMDYMNDE